MSTNSPFTTNRPVGLMVKCARNLKYALNGWFLSYQVRQMGSGCKVMNGVLISGGRNIRLGRGCFIGRNVVLDASHGKIILQDKTSIRDGVRIYATNVVVGTGTTLGEGAFLNGDISIAEGAWIARGCDLSGVVEIEKAILGPYVRCSGEPDHPRDKGTNEILMDAETETSTLSRKPSYRVRVENGAWLGEGAIVLKGVTVEKGAIVGAGSVVTRNVPEFSTVVGSPAKVIKRADR